ncbi:MAG: ThiF family adenylyltransferase [Planctomycetota bacterium]
MNDFHSAADRYARQRQFALIGDDGQRRLQNASVAIVGCGALGTVAAEILARAGIGKLRIIDRDVVEWTNLQRQSLFTEQDAVAAQAKADVACQRLQTINSEIDIEPQVIDVTCDNIEALLTDCDLAIDACDNFSLRLLLNDWSLANRTPFVHGGCVGGVGQLRLFDGLGRPCFRCLVPDVPPPGAVQTCDTAGVIGSATHTIASLQANEAIKWLSGNADAVRNTVLSIDFWNNRWREVEIGKSLSDVCPACSRQQYDFLKGDRGTSDQAVSLCGRDSIQIAGRPNTRLNLASIAGAWEKLGEVQQTKFFVRLHLDQSKSLTLFRDGRAVVAGTDEVSEARSLYDRYVG